MSLDQIKRQLAAVKHPLTSSSSLPPGCYHDATWYQHELRNIFLQNWFCVGRRDQWKKTGDFGAIEIAGIPIVIVQNDAGDLHAMSNTCLHRGSTILQGSGNCKVMICPFHGWSYNHYGQLISAPRMECAENFSVDEYKLKLFAVQCRDGFVFVSIEDSPLDIDHWLGDFADVHMPWRLQDLVTGRRRVFEVKCNWKLYMEVFNEYYHLASVHPESISGYYPEPEAADIVIGEYTTQFGVTTMNPALLMDSQDAAFPTISSLGENEKCGTRYTWVYPNLTFAASVDCIWMYHVYPAGPDTTRVVQTVCFPAETAGRKDFQSKAATYYHRFDLAIDEDIEALERQQTGMASPYARQGRFSALEPSVGNFACWYAERMG